MRGISSRTYLVAGIITLVIFTLGVLLGLIIESKRLAYMESQDREQQVNYESLQLQYLYLSTLTEGNESCPAFSATLDEYIKDLEKSRIRLETYLEDSNAYSDEFRLLKREYVIAQVNYWILSRKTKEFCGTDYVTILYFHSKDCKDCENQGFILDYWKREFKEKLLIFSFDSNFKEEPLIQLLDSRYNITKTPTLIVEDVKLEGMQSKEDLREKICYEFREEPEACH